MLRVEDRPVERTSEFPIFDEPPTEYVVSLGGHCYTASMLDRLKLRRFSLPFDWLFSDVGIIADSLSDDFKAFLDRDKYIECDADGRCGHRDYSKLYNRPVIFSHHFVKRNDEHYAQTCKTVARFRRLLNRPGRKLFVAIVDVSRHSMHDAGRLYAALDDRTTNFRLVIVNRHASKEPVPSLSLRHSESSMTIYDFYETSRMKGGLTYENDADNLKLMEMFDGMSWDLRDKESLED